MKDQRVRQISKLGGDVGEGTDSRSDHDAPRSQLLSVFRGNTEFSARTLDTSDFSRIRFRNCLPLEPPAIVNEPVEGDWPRQVVPIGRLVRAQTQRTAWVGSMCCPLRSPHTHPFFLL